MKRIALVALMLAGCASVPIQTPEVARLQAFADSIESGWRVEAGWASYGYLGNIVDSQPYSPSWMKPKPTIYLRDEIVGTRCAEVIVARLFTRYEQWKSYGSVGVDAGGDLETQTHGLLAARGWSPAEIQAAWASCPTNLPALPAPPKVTPLQ